MQRRHLHLHTCTHALNTCATRPCKCVCACVCVCARMHACASHTPGRAPCSGVRAVSTITALGRRCMMYSAAHTHACTHGCCGGGCAHGVLWERQQFAHVCTAAWGCYLVCAAPGCTHTVRTRLLCGLGRHASARVHCGMAHPVGWSANTQASSSRGLACPTTLTNPGLAFAGAHAEHSHALIAALKVQDQAGLDGLLHG